MTKMTTAKRQIVFIADLNKCIGCQTCTVACKRLWSSNPGQSFMYWRNVETAPGVGYPRNWADKGGGWKNGEVVHGRRPALSEYGVPFEFDYQGRLFEGNPGRVRPSPAPRWAPNWDEDQGQGEFPNNYYFYVPRMCNHCDKPACLEACPNDAIYKRVEDGIVVIHKDKCKGSQNCIEACPYAKPFYNATEVKANKCIGCFPRVEKNVAPACVAQCVGRAMHVGFIDDTNSSVYKLVRQFKVALPLHPEFGTEPNMYYVPPILGPSMEDGQGQPTGKARIPKELLVSMFGKEVDRVLEVLRDERAKKQAGGQSELMNILIGTRSAEMMISPLT